MGITIKEAQRQIANKRRELGISDGKPPSQVHKPESIGSILRRSSDLQRLGIVPIAYVRIVL